MRFWAISSTVAPLRHACKPASPKRASPERSASGQPACRNSRCRIQLHEVGPLFGFVFGLAAGAAQAASPPTIAIAPRRRTGNRLRSAPTPNCGRSKASLRRPSRPRGTALRPARRWRRPWSRMKRGFWRSATPSSPISPRRSLQPQGKGRVSRSRRHHAQTDRAAVAHRRRAAQDPPGAMGRGGRIFVTSGIAGLLSVLLANRKQLGLHAGQGLAVPRHGRDARQDQAGRASHSGDLLPWRRRGSARARRRHPFQRGNGQGELPPSPHRRAGDATPVCEGAAKVAPARLSPLKEASDAAAPPGRAGAGPAGLRRRSGERRDVRGSARRRRAPFHLMRGLCADPSLLALARDVQSSFDKAQSRLKGQPTLLETVIALNNDFVSGMLAL